MRSTPKLPVVFCLVALVGCSPNEPTPFEEDDLLDEEGIDGGATGPDLRTPPVPDLFVAGDMPAPMGPPVVRFVAMGDTGKGNDGQKAVADAIQKKCAMSGCDFVQLLGDNIYDSGVDGVNDPQWQTKFEIPYMAINLPFYAVLGNHDYGANGAGTDFPRGANEVKYSMKSTKWRMPAAHYHFAQKHVEFFALDTNKMMFGAVNDQRPALRNWIAGSTASWKIAFGHHPYLSNGPHGNAGSYEGLPWLPIVNGKGVKDFLDQEMCGKMDLYICGHDHNRQWLVGTCKGTELVVSGAGASTTELEGKNQARYQASTLGFLYVKIEGRTLTADFIDTTGKVEFTRTITK